jgi:hypothetical protein
MLDTRILVQNGTHAVSQWGGRLSRQRRDRSGSHREGNAAITDAGYYGAGIKVVAGRLSFVVLFGWERPCMERDCSH